MWNGDGKGSVLTYPERAHEMADLVEVSVEDYYAFMKTFLGADTEQLAAPHLMHATALVDQNSETGYAPTYPTNLKTMNK